jgi:hypothetical protein
MSLVPLDPSSPAGKNALYKDLQAHCEPLMPPSLGQAMFAQTVRIAFSVGANDLPTVKQFADATNVKPKAVLEQMVEKELTPDEHFVGGPIVRSKKDPNKPKVTSASNLALKLTAKGIHVLAALMPGSDGRDYSDFVFQVLGAFVRLRDHMVARFNAYELERAAAGAELMEGRTAFRLTLSDAVCGPDATMTDEARTKEVMPLIRRAAKGMHGAFVPDSASGTAACRLACGYPPNKKNGNLIHNMTPHAARGANFAESTYAATLQAHEMETSAQPALASRKRVASDIIAECNKRFRDDRTFVVSNNPEIQARIMYTKPTRASFMVARASAMVAA